MMTKYETGLVLLFAASCLAGAQKPKLAKFLPPLESHGLTISGYGCDRLFVADNPTPRSVSFWSLIVWAQYGKDHKKYWQKTYGNYEIPVKPSVSSNGESAAGGDAIGGYETKSYDFTPMDKACAEWSAQMKSTLKIDPEREREPTAESKKPGAAEEDTPAHIPGTLNSAPADSSDQIDYASAPYMDLPLAQLVERIPELKSLQLAPDQQDLPTILQKMGGRVDDFVRNIGDLIAHEDVTQERLGADGETKAKERFQDNYLILPHGFEWGASAEYRMDDNGNRLGSIGLSNGYMVTSGHALSCMSFSSVAQPQSSFRFLGEEKIGSRDTYVLGFAQRPGEATFTTTITGPDGTNAGMLTQGILWVDKNSFQIIVLRSDLLAANKEIRLDQLTTEVTFGEVHLQEIPNPLWLPDEVDVSIEIGHQKFRNVHHYTDYRRYRVSVKIGAPQ
jgi:hypothetical protein